MREQFHVNGMCIVTDAPGQHRKPDQTIILTDGSCGRNQCFGRLFEDFARYFKNNYRVVRFFSETEKNREMSKRDSQVGVSDKVACLDKIIEYEVMEYPDNLIYLLGLGLGAPVSIIDYSNLAYKKDKKSVKKRHSIHSMILLNPVLNPEEQICSNSGQMTDELKLLDKEVIKYMRNVRIPVLTVYGTDDKGFPEGKGRQYQGARDLGGYFSNRQLKIIEGAGQSFRGRHEELFKAIEFFIRFYRKPII